MKKQFVIIQVFSYLLGLSSCHQNKDSGKKNENYRYEYKIERKVSEPILFPEEVFKAYKVLFNRTEFNLDPEAIKTYNQNSSAFKVINAQINYLHAQSELLRPFFIYFPGHYYYNSDELIDLEVEIELASNYHSSTPRPLIYLEVENNFKIIYKEPILPQIIGEFKGKEPTVFKKYIIKISDLPYAYYLFPKIYATKFDQDRIEIFIKKVSYKIIPKKKVVKNAKN